MNLFRRTLAPILGACLAALCIVAPVQAQLDQTPQSLNAQATNEMKVGNWEVALKLLTACTDQFDKNAPMLYGPQFGVTWYRKGICELKLRRWEDAMKSFETCNRRYANKATQAGGGANIFEKRALLRGGEAAQGAEDWNAAIRLFKKFIEERDPERDSYNPGSFYINMAICYFKLNKIPDGIKNFETALKNKVKFKTPEAGIVAAFQAMVDAVIEKRDEKSLIAFVATNRSDIVIEAYDMQPYASLFLSLAGKAYHADMERVAFLLYQLIPATEVMLEDVESRLAGMGNRRGMQDGFRVIRRDTLQSSREALKASIKSGNPHEVIQLGATAFLHEDHGNVRGAYAAYEQLELFYPKCGDKKREKNLYNLVRTASVIGEVLATEKYGSRFLADFPDSKHVPAVRRLMLTSLFYSGEYEICLEIATPMLPKLKAGTKGHDICLHVLGGSLYYTGDYKAAQPELDKHVELYPKSGFEQAALYFQASNLSRLQFWSKSAKLLDEFFEKHPDPGKNIYFSFGLYDRANCHYAMDENEAALEKLNRLETEFPNADIMDMTYNLKGNVLQNSGKKPEAEAYYKKALELAEHRENDIVAGEALYYLIAMLGDKPKKKDAPNRMKEAVPYSDKFWKEYGDASPYKAQVAVAQIHALQDAGRGEEALNRLRDVIAEMAITPGAVGLEEAIGSYTEVYLEDHTAQELKDHYYNFPKIKAANKAARALLRIALIGVFEDAIKKSQDDRQKRIQAEAGIKVLFTDLKQEFDLDDLSNFILVRVGDFIRGTGSSREALRYYDEALNRDEKSYKFPALFGRAAVLAQGSNAEKKKALADFKRVLEDSDDRGDRDRALFQMIVTQRDMGDYAGAVKNARLYLDREKGFSSKKPDVAFMLAQSYDDQGDASNAITNYMNTWNSYKGTIRVSAPSMKRYMELIWDRNQPSDGKSAADHQGAYNAGRTFTDQTGRFLDKMSPEEQVLWKEVDALVNEYVARPEVKSKEQLIEESKR